MPLLSNGKTLTGQDGVYASSSIDRKTGKLYVYPASTPVKVAGRKINAEAEPLSVSVFIIDFKTI